MHMRVSYSMRLTVHFLVNSSADFPDVRVEKISRFSPVVGGVLLQRLLLIIHGLKYKETHRIDSRSDLCHLYLQLARRNFSH